MCAETPSCRCHHPYLLLLLLCAGTHRPLSRGPECHGCLQLLLLTPHQQARQRLVAPQRWGVAPKLLTQPGQGCQDF
jgi:hypothetical protein